MVQCNMAVPHYGNASHNVEWYGAMHKDHNASMVMLHRNNMRVVFKHGGLCGCEMLGDWCQ